MRRGVSNGEDDGRGFAGVFLEVCMLQACHSSCVVLPHSVAAGTTFAYRAREFRVLQ